MTSVDETPYPVMPPMRQPLDPPKRRDFPNERLRFDVEDLAEYEEHRAPSTAELAAVMSENLETIDHAYGELRRELDELKAKPKRERRTGAAARMNPDDIRLGQGVLWGTAVFGAAAFLVSFGGQYAMAPYTQLPEILWWAVPFFIEAPIILLSFMIAVFRRRKQHTSLPWIVIIGLTALSSAINVAHVYIESGGLTQLGDWFGATVMGLAPWLVLIAFEELVRLAVKPTDPEPAPPARKPTPKNRSTKR